MAALTSVSLLNVFSEKYWIGHIETKLQNKTNMEPKTINANCVTWSILIAIPAGHTWMFSLLSTMSVLLVNKVPTEKSRKEKQVMQFIQGLYKSSRKLDSKGQKKVVYYPQLVENATLKSNVKEVLPWGKILEIRWLFYICILCYSTSTCPLTSWSFIIIFPHFPRDTRKEEWKEEENIIKCHFFTTCLCSLQCTSQRKTLPV